MNYSDDWLTILEGDCREVMATMEPESVHCVVTSPPYWGLRDYGTATWLGGDEGCDHRNYPGAATGNKGAVTSTPMHQRCSRCGAVRQDSQLGLEPTPEAYVESMVAVFREVRRVLRADGTVWLNLGDSYAANRPGAAYGWTNGKTSEHDAATMAAYAAPKELPAGLKPKDLVGIPWRVAFALQADGWYLRSDIIWSKANPMPESVTDRPTKAHEYLFLLSKSPRYYYDADAVRETSSPNTHSRGNGIGVKNAGTEFGQGIKHNADYAAAINGPVSARNLRSVWSIATQPYPGAHFATFPEKLVEPCILAGTSAKGVCPECGAPWTREVLPGRVLSTGGSKTGARASNMATVSPLGQDPASGAYNTGEFRAREHTTIGWRPPCLPIVDPVPATILDPFAGSGTVGRVAARLSRRAVLIDLNADYLGQAMKRNQDIPLGLETVG